MERKTKENLFDLVLMVLLSIISVNFLINIKMDTTQISMGCWLGIIVILLAWKRNNKLIYLYSVIGILIALGINKIDLEIDKKKLEKMCYPIIKEFSIDKFEIKAKDRSSIIYKSLDNKDMSFEFYIGNTTDKEELKEELEKNYRNEVSKYIFQKEIKEFLKKNKIEFEEPLHANYYSRKTDSYKGENFKNIEEYKQWVNNLEEYDIFITVKTDITEKNAKKTLNAFYQLFKMFKGKNTEKLDFVINFSDGSNILIDTNEFQKFLTIESFEDFLNYYDNAKIEGLKIEKQGLLPYIEAIKRESVVEIEMLINDGVNFSEVNKFSPLTGINYAIILGNKDIVKLLIENGYSVNEKDYFARKAIYYALKKNDIEMIQLLCRNKTELNEIIDEKGNYPLDIVRNNSSEVEEMLKRLGAKKMKGEEGN